MKGRRVALRLLILAICMIGPLVAPFAAHAEVPYQTYSRDSYGKIIWTQSAYQPVSVMATEIFVPDPNNQDEMVHTTLNGAQDLFITDNDEIYIADTGNHRIVHLDPDGELIQIIDLPGNSLKSPEGVFVDKKGTIYIADTGNKRIVLVDPNGNFVRDYGLPESNYIPKAYQFEPFNLVVDRRGFMYIASKGSYQGLMLVDPDGDFHGFFGTNSTESTIFDRFKLMFYSEELLSREVRLLPRAIRSVAIDDTGFVYTTTIGGKDGQIKKYNIRSENVLDGLKFGEIFRERTRTEPQLIDIAIDNNKNMIAIDRTTSAINMYSEHGDLLFFWRGYMVSGQTQLGLIQSPSAVATNSKNELFILDSQQNNIQRMKPSQFGELVFTAMKLMNDGKYQESVPYFEEIIRLNANFSPAYKGLGLAAFHNGDYDLASEMFELAGYKDGYSENFWQIRLSWFQNNFSYMANAFLAVGAIWVAGGLAKKRLKPRTKKKRFKKHWLIDQLLHSFYILKHPIDGFIDLRYERKGSYWSAFVMLILAFLAILFKTFYTNFHFTGDQPIHEIKSSFILLQFLIFWFSWVIGNYLISSIYRGEGRFTDVFIGSAYALTPIIILSVPVVLISNVLTLSESSIYSFFDGLIIGWVGLLFFWMVQSLQNYSVGETLINIFLTIITMIILWVLILIITGLASEFFNFLYAVYQEVTMR